MKKKKYLSFGIILPSAVARGREYTIYKLHLFSSSLRYGGIGDIVSAQTNTTEIHITHP